MTISRGLPLLLFAAVALACDGYSIGPYGRGSVLVVQVVDETFRIRITDPWSWHLVPGTVGFAEAAIELCDGKPSFVEAELDYWLNTVRTYCPWSARIIAEER